MNMKFYRTSYFSLIAMCIFLLASCNKKTTLIGKWKLVDKTVVTNSHETDSFENAHAKEGVRKGEFYTFLDDENYLHTTGDNSIEGKYEAKDSFVALTNNNLAMPIMIEGYKYRLIDENTMQFVEEITNVKTGRVFTYTLFLKREMK